MLKKKIWPSFQRIIDFLLKNLSLSSKKYGFGIQDLEYTYSGSGSRGQKGTGSRIRIRNTEKCWFLLFCVFFMTFYQWSGSGSTGSIFFWPPRSASGSVRHRSWSEDPDPKPKCHRPKTLFKINPKKISFRPWNKSKGRIPCLFFVV